MDIIINALKTLVLGMIEHDLTSIFEDLYEGLGQIQGDITITPSTWLDGNIWSFMEQVYSIVMMPVATAIFTFILTVEIYHVVIERNAMKDIDISSLFMIFFKMGIGVLVISNASKIVLGLFDIGNWAVQQTVKIIPLTISGPADFAAEVVERLASPQYSLGVCFSFWLYLFIAKLIVFVVKTIALVVVYGRLLQMVIYACFAPIPVATFMNKEWNIGQNYIKNIFALAFQGFLIVFLFGAYSIIIATPVLSSPDIKGVYGFVFGHIGWSVLLCMMLTKTNSITQSIFGAH